MTGSTVPAVIDALVTLATTATGANVIYGEPPRGQTGDFIAIASNANGAGVTNQQAITDMGMRSSLETFDVECEAVAWAGDTDLQPLVARAYALLNLFDAALLANPSLTGACMLADRTHSDLFPMQTTTGGMARLAFTVHVQAQR